MLPVADLSTPVTPVRGRVSYARIVEKREIPDLIELQVRSFAWFVEKGLRELFDEISPIRDFTAKVMELQFLDYEFGDPKYSELECRTRDLTFSRPLYVQVELLIKETGEIQRQRVYMGDYPWMTHLGTFIINGAERVVVSQLVRSPGVYYGKVEDPASGRDLFTAKVIPNRGAWLEFETSARGDLLSVKVDRKRKIAATTLLRAVGYERNEEIAALFGAVDDNPEHAYIASTLDKDPTNTQAEALIEVYKKLRPGDPPTGDNARQLVESLFFNFRRYDLGRVGRYKFNKKLNMVAGRMGIELPREDGENPQLGRTISREDIAAIVGQLIILNNGHGLADDIDHLGNRRIRANGELIQNAFRIGLLRMERVVRERMTIQEIDKATPNALINIRPVVAAMKEFFGGSQLSQFMDQTNPLAELTSKRRLSALGPGGLSRERAGFDVRDVHHSHYGRICPIETPEGPNIGLIGSLATFGRINDYGFIETPYRKVKRTIAWDDPDLTSYVAGSDVVAKGGAVVVRKGEPLTSAAAAELKKQKALAQPIRPVVTDEIVYLAADEEEEHWVAQANAALDEQGHFITERVPCRHRDQFPEVTPDRIEYMDVSPKQVVSVATALIPFLEHDDANRALMGSNMQRQAVPLLEPEAPIVGTGHGAPRRARLGPGRRRPRGRRRHLGDRRADPRRGGLRRAADVPAPEVRPLEPGHLHQPASDRLGRPAPGRRRADRRLVVDRRRRAGPGPQHPGGLHELGGRQLRGRDRHQRSPRPRGPLHQHPHREARDRVARHEARARGDHPRHPERGRGVPQGPRRGRDRLHRGRGPARRHPRRQDHAEGRDRADRRGAPPAGDLRREGPRGEGLQPAPAARRAGQGRRREDLHPRSRRRAPARV